MFWYLFLSVSVGLVGNVLQEGSAITHESSVFTLILREVKKVAGGESGIRLGQIFEVFSNQHDIAFTRSTRGPCGLRHIPNHIAPYRLISIGNTKKCHKCVTQALQQPKDFSLYYRDDPEIPTKRL